jgi:hypothetical protein
VVKVELTVGPVQAKIHLDGGRVVVELESVMGWLQFALPPGKALELAEALAKVATFAKEDGKEVPHARVD